MPLGDYKISSVSPDKKEIVFQHQDGGKHIILNRIDTSPDSKESWKATHAETKDHLAIGHSRGNAFSLAVEKLEGQQKEPTMKSENSLKEMLVKAIMRKVQLYIRKSLGSTDSVAIDTGIDKAASELNKSESPEWPSFEDVDNNKIRK